MISLVRRVGGQQQRHRIAGQAHDHEDHGGHEPERDEGAEEALTEERDESAHSGDLAATLSPCLRGEGRVRGDSTSTRGGT